ncbi:MAG: NosD domain-containing protein, partial [Patescibacteria group bacterium]|nr:NosD domain-containing protein [Patescibacteria group bacterium]
IDQTNLVDGKPILYLRNAANQVVDATSNAGTVYCIECQNMTFKNLSFANEFASVYLHQNQNTTVQNISSQNSYLGVYEQFSMGNKVQDSKMDNNYYGVLVTPVGGCSSGTCQYARIENNHITNCYKGIYFNHFYIRVYGNFLEKNKTGLFAYGSYALIRNNTFSENDLGVQFRFFDANKMYNNNFINNQTQTAVDKSRNPIFNLGIPTGGNYWSNWLEPNLNGDDFVDFPYEISPGYFDNLPWVKPNGWLPVTTAYISGEMGENDWYRSDVIIALHAEDNEGIDRTEYSFDNCDWTVYTNPIAISNEGETRLRYRSIDIVGDKEEIKSLAVKIDKTPPEIVLINPVGGVIYFKNQLVVSQWSAGDDMSGLKSATASIASDQPIDTSTTGMKDFEIIAEDFAGNRISKKINYSVIYFYSSLFDENKKHSKGYKSGSGLPVKFEIQSDGIDPSQIEARLYLALVVDGVVGDKIPATSKGNSNEENSFRYSVTEDQFVYNLDTKGLSCGTWQLIIEFNFGASVSTEIEIR